MRKPMLRPKRISQTGKAGHKSIIITMGGVFEGGRLLMRLLLRY